MQNVHDNIDKSNIRCDSIDYTTKIIYGGQIFKRTQKKGYWILKAPCLNCYCRLAGLYEDDISELKKCCVLVNGF
jgi:hypothetical protein